MHRLVAATVLFALSTILLHPSIAAATPEDEVKRLHAYVKSSAIADRLVVAKAMTDARLGRLCPFDETPRIRIADINGPYGTFSFPDGESYPTQGLFRVRYTVEDCLSPRTYNALFISRFFAPPSMTEDAPGNTLADPVVARDMQPLLVAKAILALPGREHCKDIRVLDTAVVQPPRKGQESGIKLEYWTETWDVSVCGEGIALSVNFSRSSIRPGVSFEIKSSDEDRKVKGVPLPDQKGDQALRTMMSGGMFSTKGLERISSGMVLVSARDNSPLAQFIRAQGCHYQGGCPSLEAFYWGWRAAYNGSAEAMLLLGAWNSDGIYVERDISRAVAWFKAAGKNGQPQAAAALLQTMAKNGLIDSKSHKEIVRRESSLFDIFKGTDGASSSGEPANQAIGDSMR